MRLRSGLYRKARGLGDYQAMRSGDVVGGTGPRLAGRATGRALGAGGCLLPACAALALVAACACSGNGGSKNESTASTTTAAQPAATAAPTTVLHTEGNATAQPVGTPFHFDLTVNERDKTILQITVRRPIVCGIKGYAIPANRDTGEPARNLYAPSGQRYCEVDLLVKNVGKRQAQFTPGGYIYDEKDQQFQHDEEATVAEEDSLPSSEFGGVNTIEVNPTESRNTLIVFPLPTGAAPAYVEIGDNGVTENIQGERLDARVNITAADISWKHPRGQ